MIAFEKKVNRLASRHGWNVEKNTRNGVQWYIIPVASYADGRKVDKVLSRHKDVYFKLYAPWGDGYEGLTVRLCDRTQWEAYLKAQDEREYKTRVLNRTFWEALSANNYNQNAAKAAQYEKAVQIGALDVFNAIYA